MDPAALEMLQKVADSNLSIADSQKKIAELTTAARVDRHADRITAARTLSADGAKLQARIAKIAGATATLTESMALVSDVSASLAVLVSSEEKRARLVELVAGESDALRRGAAVAAWPTTDFDCVGNNVFEAKCTVKLWVLLQLPAMVLNSLSAPHDKETLGNWMLRTTPHRWALIFQQTVRAELREAAPLFFWQHVGYLLLLSTPADFALVSFRDALATLTADTFPDLISKYTTVSFTKGRVSMLTGSTAAASGLATAHVTVSTPDGADEVLAIIDTGANRSLASASLVSRCATGGAHGAESVTVADGSLTVALDKHIITVNGVEIEVLVMPGSADIDLLLGVPALQLLGGALIAVPPAGPPTVAMQPVKAHEEPTPKPAQPTPAQPNPTLQPDATVLFVHADFNSTNCCDVEFTFPLEDQNGTEHSFSIEISGTQLLDARGALTAAVVEAVVRAHAALDSELSGGQTAACFYLAAAESDTANVDALPLATAPPGPYQYATAFDVFIAKVRAADGTDAQKDSAIACARSVGLKGTSKLAPPEYGYPPLKGVVHKIVLRRGASLRGVRAGYRSRSPVKEAALRKQLNEWLAAGFLERTAPNTGFALSAPVMIPKPNDMWRMAVDFRALNAQSEADPFPPPPMQACLQLAAKGYYTTILDGAYLFNQIELDKESRPLTATLFGPNQIYQFTRAPFGLNSILGTAQRHMSKVFDVEDERMAYVDDVIQSHQNESRDAAWVELEELIETCAHANVVANFDKLLIIEKKVPLFGYTVSRGQITPQHARCAAIINWPEPQNNSELRQLLQTAQYYSAYIPDWTNITVPLWTLIKRSQPLVWTLEARGYLQRLRAGFAHAAVVPVYDPTQPVEICTDACDYAVSATAGQRDNLGVLRYLCTAGRRLRPTEVAHPIDVKEALALGFAMRRFDSYIEGVPWGWITDCASLANIERAPIFTKHVAAQRVMLQLQQHIGRVKITVVTHKDNLFADALGRYHLRDADAKAFMLRSGKSYLPTDGEYARSRPISTLESAGVVTPPSSPEPEPVEDNGMRSVPDSPLHDEPEINTPPPNEPREPLITPPDSPPKIDDRPKDDLGAPLKQPPQELDGDKKKGNVMQPPSAVDVDTLVGDDRRRVVGFDIEESQEEWAAATRDDPFGRHLRRFAAGETAPQSARSLLPSVDSTGRVYVRVDGQQRLYVPRSKINDLMGAFHNGTSGGHRSADQMVLRLREHFYWPEMHKSAELFCKTCGPCARMAPARPLTDLGTKDEALKLRVINVDMIPMPEGVGDKHCIILIRDACTGHTVVRALENRRWSSIRPAIEDEWLLQHGPPARLVPDGASELTGKGMAELAKQYGFIVTPTAPYNSQQNGTAESAVKMVKRAIMATLGDRPLSDWPLVLQVAAWQYNTAISAPRGTSPYSLMRGMVPPNAVQRKMGIETATHNETQEALNNKIAQSLAEAAARKEARHRVDLATVAQRGEAFTPRVGQIVWLENPAAPTTIEAKHHKRDGPFEVVSVDATGKHLCRIKQWGTQTKVKGDVAFRRLSPFTPPLKPPKIGPLEQSDAVAPPHAPPHFYNARQRTAHARDVKKQRKAGLQDARVLHTRFDAVYGPMVLLVLANRQALEVPLSPAWRYQFQQFRKLTVHTAGGQ